MPEGSWVPGADGSGFGIDNLPYGVFRAPGTGPRLGIAIGGHVLDLQLLDQEGLLRGPSADPALRTLRPDVFHSGTLNGLLAAGRPAWDALRARLVELLTAGSPHRSRVEPALFDTGLVDLLCPVAPPDYVDFYSSIEHASNLGRLFRPDGDPLLPNWRWLPVAYHGRSSSVVASGTGVRRPLGQRPPAEPGGAPTFGPSVRLDFELELGFVTGDGPPLGTPIPTSDAREHIFGVVLVNDWSARDLQRWEYQPLGPFLGKSFATSVAPWVVPLEALEPFRVAPPAQEPLPLAYLRVDEPWAYDIALEVALAPEGGSETVISRTNARGLYWTMPQQLAHATINGANVRAGDLYASGTISGAEPGSQGSLIELTSNGREPLALAGGGERVFLQDGDTVVLRGWCEGGGSRVSLGEVSGTIAPAPEGAGA